MSKSAELISSFKNNKGSMSIDDLQLISDNVMGAMASSMNVIPRCF